MELNSVGSTLNLSSATEWLDLYTLLDVSPDADVDMLRKRISARYNEAVSNSNHRDSQKREQYQLLSQQLIPQCRWILLNPEFRASYDQQWALHQAGASNALPYKVFLGTLTEEGIASASDPTAADSADADSVSASHIGEPATTPVAPAPNSEVITTPVATTIAAESTLTPDDLGNTTVDMHMAKPIQQETMPDMAGEIDAPAIIPIIKDDKPLLTPVGQTAEEKQPIAKQPVPVKRNVQPKISSVASASSNPKVVTNTIIQDNVALPRDVQKAVKQAAKTSRVEAKAAAKPSTPSYVSRVVVGDTTRATTSGLFKPGERALSDTSVALLTAIVATMLSITIDIFSMPDEFGLSAALYALSSRPLMSSFIRDDQDD